ncbi:MAG: hypothetical protein QGD93_07145 [Actinomycetota bacterium]|nr:hypothetical protein [Actinomycetota bacterium]
MSQISLTGTSADRSGTPKCRFPGGESFDCCVLAVPCNIVIPADEWRDCALTIVIGKVIEETTARGMLLPETVNAATRALECTLRSSMRQSTTSNHSHG